LIDFHRADQRIPDEGIPPPPFTWDYAKRLLKEGGFYACRSDKDLALCTCSRGHTTRLSGFVHTIAADGACHPSYVCPIKGCDFHDWVRLVGWDPNHVYEVVNV
jgi:hypothetical protein